MTTQPLKLVQFRTTEDIPNYSPFCVKAEVLLIMAGLPYEIETLDDPRKSKKGKLPMLRDGAKTIADSEFIKRYLIAEKGADFDGHLSVREQAQAHAFSKMIEERTYWNLVYDRWVNDENWPGTSKFWFGDMPFPLKYLIPKLARKGVVAGLKGHGIGRHSPAELYELGKSDLDAIAAQLGDQDFLFGETPSSADASAFGLLVNFSGRGQLPSTMRNTMKAYPSLLAYVDRCMDRWFPKMAAQ
jgi:glutathione S-transferase